MLSRLSGRRRSGYGKSLRLLQVFYSPLESFGTYSREDLTRFQDYFRAETDPWLRATDRPYPIVAAAPGVPAERVKILREAFGLTLKTPEFLEEAKKNKWEIKPVGGDELDALAKEVTKPSTEVIERLKLLLGD